MEDSTQQIYAKAVAAILKRDLRRRLMRAGFQQFLSDQELCLDCDRGF